MQDKKNLVVEDNLELTDDQLENVVGGINIYKDIPFGDKLDKISKAGCKSCGSLNITKTFPNRSVMTCTCQDCGYSWDERAF